MNIKWLGVLVVKDKLNDLSIRVKMSILVSVLVSITLTVALFGYSQMQLIKNELHSIVEDDIPLTELTTAMTTKQLEGAIIIEKAMRIAGLTGNELPNNQLHQQFSQLSAEIDDELIKVESILKHAAETTTSIEQLHEINALQADLVLLKNEHISYELTANQLLTHIDQGNIQAAEAQLTAIEQEQQQLDSNLEHFLINIENLTKHALLQTEKHEATAVQGMLSVGLFGIIIGAFLGWLFTKRITRSLQTAVEASKQVANGNFSISVQSEGNDEFGTLLKSINRMARKLDATISEVLRSSEQIANVAQDIAATTEQTNQSIQSQQLNTESVVTAMTEMTTTVQQVADSTIQASSITQSAKNEASSGSQVVSTNLNEITQLVTQIQSASNKVESVSKESNSISAFVKNISEIADQTNLLALNAAIEAARAGEAGRGFAVVADEVRNLSQRTQGTTSDIHRLISDLQEKSTQAVEAIAQSIRMVDTSAEHAQHASQSLKSIDKSVDEVNDMSLEIAAVCEQQAATAEEINQNVVSISQSGSEVLAGSAITAHSSENLASLAVELRSLMSQFKVSAA